MRASSELDRVIFGDRGREKEAKSVSNKTAKLLVVEDDFGLLTGLGLSFRAEGYEVVKANRGLEALRLAADEGPSLILLGVMLPDMNGLDVCRELRRRGDGVPIILLTGKSQEADLVEGLEAGADDCVQKPFSMQELLARVRVRLRNHANQRVEKVCRYRFGDVEVDFERYQASRRGETVKLTPRESEILRLLLDFRGQLVTRRRLVTAVFGEEANPATRSLDNHILKLRQKLEETPAHPKHILSVYGRGYKFVE